MKELKTELPELELVPPDVERDAPNSVKWLEGDSGQDTMRRMGNTATNIKLPTLEGEKERIQGFLDSTDQLTWAIRFENKTVGAVWVELKNTEYLPAPAIHIMIGDPAVRGHGIGENTVRAVVDYMRDDGNFDQLHSRHLTENDAAAGLLKTIGFEDINDSYADNDGLEWQNMVLALSE